MDLRQITKQTFNKIYGHDVDRRLIYIGTQEGTGFMTFIITNGFDVMCTFNIGDSGIFNATSDDYLLVNEYELSDWLNFVRTLKQKLRG